MLSPIPRRGGWDRRFCSCSPNPVSLPRKGHRVGPRIVLFEACSAFTRVTACTLALSPICDTLSEGFSYFVTSIAAPAASGWSGRRVGLAPTGKRRLVTAHTRRRHLRSRANAPHPLFFFTSGFTTSRAVGTHVLARPSCPRLGRVRPGLLSAGCPAS